MKYIHEPNHIRIVKNRSDEIPVLVLNDDDTPHEFGFDPVAILVIKRNPDSEEALLTLLAVPDTETGLCRFKIRPEHTASFKPGIYWYGVSLKENNSLFRSVIPISMIDVLPIESGAFDKNAIAIDRMSPDIIICTRTRYNQMGFHPEKWAILVDQFPAADNDRFPNATKGQVLVDLIAKASRNPSGLVELQYGTGYGEVTAVENANPMDVVDETNAGKLQYAPNIIISDTENVYGKSDFTIVGIYNYSYGNRRSKKEYLQSSVGFLVSAMGDEYGEPFSWVRHFTGSGKFIPDPASTWAAEINYTRSIDHVLYNDKIYECAKTHTSTSSLTPNTATEYWAAITD